MLFIYIYYVTQKITKQEHLELEKLQKIRILSLIKLLLYLIKKCVIITNAISSVHIWVNNHPSLIPSVFLKINEKKHDSSPEYRCTHFCHQTFSIYILLTYPFSSLFIFLFFWVLLFFCCFPLMLWPEKQLLPLLYYSIFRSCWNRSENWN